MKKIKSLIKFANGKTSSYCDCDEKQKLHRLGKAALKELASILGIDADIRSNKGGIAVSGEVTLHSNKVYLQISPSSFGLPVLLRSCNGKKDYTGGRNEFFQISDLDKQNFLNRIKTLSV